MAKRRPGQFAGARFKKKGPHVSLIQQSRRVSPAEKAAYHQIVGAGKRHVKRQFFGISARDEEAIVRLIEKQIDKAIKEP